MVILLAESKSMSTNQVSIEKSVFENHMPVLEELADQTMSFLAEQNPDRISEILGVSTIMAKNILKLAYDFPLKSTGYKAIEGFTGVAYRALAAKSLSSQALEFANNNLRIISSLYGVLKPEDIIKPYRLDFNKNCGPDNSNIIKYLKPKTTIAFSKFIKENNVNEVLDLLPADATKCLDWKIIKAFTKVNKVCFQTLTVKGILKTPSATRIKELRGLMARLILQKNITSFTDLIQEENENFIFSAQDSKPGLPVFLSME